MEMFQRVCGRNLLVAFGMLAILTFSRRHCSSSESVSGADDSGRPLSMSPSNVRRSNDVLEIVRGDGSNRFLWNPYPLYFWHWPRNGIRDAERRGRVLLTEEADGDSVARVRRPQMRDVRLTPLREHEEPRLGEPWNITCSAEVRHDAINKSALVLTWSSADGKTLASDDNTRTNEFRTVITGGSVFAETYVRIHRVLPAHRGTYRCTARYMDLEKSSLYVLNVKYDNIGDFECTDKSECPSSMDCSLHMRCVCDNNHPVFIPSLSPASDQLCYPVVELGYFCHESSQCEKSTMNSVCLKNVCQCQKGFAMTARTMQSGSTQFLCELQESISNDKHSAYRGVMIASACFGVIFLLVIAAFPVRKCCGGKCFLFRGRYDVDRPDGRRRRRQHPRGLNSRTSFDVALHSHGGEKPPSYEEVVGSQIEDAPPSYESLGFRWVADQSERLRLTFPTSTPDLTASSTEDRGPNERGWPSISVPSPLWISPIVYVDHTSSPKLEMQPISPLVVDSVPESGSRGVVVVAAAAATKETPNQSGAAYIGVPMRHSTPIASLEAKHESSAPKDVSTSHVRSC